MMLFGILLFLCASSVSTRSIASRKSDCDSLGHGASYSIHSTLVQSGALNITDVPGNNNYTFCRVIGSIPYGVNNTINFEVWLPAASNYNERYLSVGNGGFAGTIDYATMLTNLNAGYAVGGCDSGHMASENGASEPGSYVPFLNSEAQTKAWIRDSIAAFSVPAKEIATRYYQCEPKKTYFYGCSTGGAQGYTLAEYHPEIFDGIFAGSAGNWYSHLILSFLWNGLAAKKPGAFVDSQALTFGRDAVMSKCDEIDGVKDGVIEDPTKCDFDMDSLLCQDGQAQIVDNKTVCLNEKQMQTFNAIYAGPGNDVYPGFAKGSESEWLLQENVLYAAYAAPMLQNLIFKNLSYDYSTFNFGSDVKVVDDIAGPLITATSPRLDAFKARGGKLIATQGWADPFNAPFWPIDQIEEAKTIYSQAQLDDFWRLFMVPGGGHCGSASTYPEVPGTWHTLEALVAWVEGGEAPNHILATGPADGTNTTKRLCKYPEQAVWRGGDTRDYRSYDCV